MKTYILLSAGGTKSNPTWLLLPKGSQAGEVRERQIQTSPLAWCAEYLDGAPHVGLQAEEDTAPAWW